MKSEQTIINSRIRKFAKKKYLIELLGGSCNCCGKITNNLSIYDFHHNDGLEKEYRLSRKMDCRLSELVKEANKCVLLCSNCHRKKHSKDISTYYNKHKLAMLTYKKINKCEICGECDYKLLDFHHTESNKEFELSNIKYIDSENMNYINSELDKCIVVCSNCHRDIHFDFDFYKKHSDKICNHVLREINRKLDNTKIFELFSVGMSQPKIAKLMNTSQGVISTILKKYGVTKIMSELIIDEELICKLNSNGGSVKDIANEVKCSTVSVRRILNKNGLVNSKHGIRKISDSELINEIKTKTIKQIANKYNMSVNAIKYRIKKLNNS